MFGWSADAAQRLSALVKAPGIGGVAGLARQAGISRASLYEILRPGGAVPAEPTLADLCAALGVSVEHVLGSAGAAASPVSAPSRLHDDDIVQIPFHAGVRASAGPGRLPDDPGEDSESWGIPEVWVRKHWGDPRQIRVIHIDGDSMEPTLRDGGIAVYDRSKRGPAPGVYLLRHDDMLHIKRLDHDAAGRLVILSDNPAEPPFGAGVDEVKIIGRVVWAGREL